MICTCFHIYVRWGGEDEFGGVDLRWVSIVPDEGISAEQRYSPFGHTLRTMAIIWAVCFSPFSLPFALKGLPQSPTCSRNVHVMINQLVIITFFHSIFNILPSHFNSSCKILQRPCNFILNVIFTAQ